MAETTEKVTGAIFYKTNTNIITVHGHHRFSISWSDPSASGEANLNLDFEPLIKAFVKKDDDDVYLIHWQARPKTIRRWGVYHVKTRTYTCADSVRIIGSSIGCQLDESEVKTLPTAVLIARRVAFDANANVNAAREVVLNLSEKRGKKNAKLNQKRS